MSKHRADVEPSHRAMRGDKSAYERLSGSEGCAIDMVVPDATTTTSTCAASSRRPSNSWATAASAIVRVFSLGEHHLRVRIRLSVKSCSQPPDGVNSQRSTYSALPTRSL